MNKTLLLFIVDFLFLNLIALTRWEKAEPVRPVQPPVNAVAANAPAKSEDDLVEAMRQSLADVQASRADLEGKLSAADQTLAAREQSLAATEAERTRLGADLAQTQSAAADLNLRLVAAAQQSNLTREQLAQLRKELDERRAEAERQKRTIADLNQAQAQARKQIEGLTVAVVVGEEEKQQLQQQVQAEHNERIQAQATTRQLAQGVGQLARNSGELTQEIRASRPINANTLFNDFLANRVDAVFNGSYPGLFGSDDRSSVVQTVFTTDGRQVYALQHVDQTIFSFRLNGVDWSRLGVTFSRPSHPVFHAASLRFLAADPRVVAVPVPADEVAALGVKVYALASDPFRFPEAVLVNASGKGYGAISFKLDPSLPGYVRVDNHFFKRIFGDFAPSSGDLVFAQSGELLGIMVNDDYCALLKDFAPLASFDTGEDTAAQKTGDTLDRLVAVVHALPPKLQ